jgi:hypothetical protein
MEDRWEKVRQIVREECERLEGRILAILQKGGRVKLGFEGGRWIGVTDEQMSAWKLAYGMVDIEAELKRAAAWIVSNPHLAPKSQLGRFLNTWFAKGQDRASIRSIPSVREEAPKPKKACSYCSADATGSISGILCCPDHTRDAMDGKPRRMLNVVPAPVAGRD